MRQLPKLPFLNHPRDLPTVVGWALGVFFTVLTVYWWMDSLFPGHELTAGAMTVKIGASLLTLAVSLYLMHINYD